MWYLHINFSAKIWYEGDIHVTVWHSYHKQGRRSNQCHRAMARVDFFASKPRNIVYKPRFSDRQSKSLKALEVALVVFTADWRPWVSLFCLLFGVFRRENSFHFFSSKCLIYSILQCRNERPSVFTGDIKTTDIFQKYKGDKNQCSKIIPYPKVEIKY